MKIYLSMLVLLFMLCGCNQKKVTTKADFVIADGQMPDIVKGKDNNLHLVYGTGDSIMYSSSPDNGQSFSTPVLIKVLSGLAASHMRGPQIAATKNGIIVTASTLPGDIFSYHKAYDGNWIQGSKVNDVDTTSKEGLMALSGDEGYVYAVWLDLRENMHNKIYGARSTDDGKTWLPNKMIYTSPDTTVCECCKPSVVVKGNNVYVMFRNWLNGNRDLYIIQSGDGGNTFGQAQKLGNGNWKLNGCPMDGGGLAVDKDGLIQTVWRREGKIFAATPGSPEKEIGEGRSCTMETINGKNVYAWTEKGDVIIMKPQGMKKNPGKGSLPIIKALNNEHVICVWENDKQIHASVLEL